MSLHRAPLATALISGALLLIGCPSATTPGGINFGITVGSGSTVVEPGATVSLILTADTVSGFSTTPLSGTATLTVTPTDGGAFSAGTATLGSSGTTIVSFTVCATGADCTPGQTVRIGAVLSAQGGKSANAFVNLTIAGADAGVTADAGSDAGVDAGSGVDAGPLAGAFAMVVTLNNPNNSATPANVPAAGLPVYATAAVTQGGQVVSGQSVLFSLTKSLGTITDASNSENTSTSTLTVLTNVDGNAIVLFAPETTGGVVGVLTATYQPAAVNGVVSPPIISQQVITVYAPATIKFTPNATTDNYNQVLGIASSGYQTTSTLRFTVYDTTGVPYVAPSSIPQPIVTFSIPANSASGSTFLPATAELGPTGQAVTVLSSGNSIGNVSVNASVSVVLSNQTTITLNTASTELPVVGAKASGSHLSLSCADLSLPALWNNDCTDMHVDTSTLCTAVLGDRFNNALGVATNVAWISEAGQFGPPTATASATAGVSLTSQVGLGQTSNTLSMLNTPLPEQNLTAQTANGEEPQPFSNNCGWTSTIPRDGLVTFIAAAAGEEGFTDLNGNGQWDPGEPFIDEGEPYVDENDNNQWDVGEPFIDVNGNGTYDGPNGQWDANTTIWTAGHVVVTGDTHETSSFELVPSVTLTPGSAPFNFDVDWMDINGNEPSALFTTYALALASPSFGQLAFESPADLTDQMGSMVLTQPVVCGPSPVSGVCASTNPVTQNCDCVATTSIQFNANRPAIGVYTPPASGGSSAETDTIDATATEIAGTETITPKITDPVTIGAASQSTGNNSPYTLTMDILTSSGGAFAGKIAAGDPALTVNATLTQGGVAVSGAIISFVVSNSIGTLSNGSSSGTTVTAKTNSSGIATVTLAPESGSANEGILTVSYTPATGTAPSPQQQLITVVVPAELSFTPGADFNATMGVANSGYNETSTVTFTLLDDTGAAYLSANPVLVSFSLVNTGGARVSPSSIDLDVSGQVSAVVTSGTVAGTTAVTAQTTVNGITLTGTSSTIAIVGAKANGRNFDISCSPDSVPALWGNDCSFMHVDVSSTCTAVIGDRYGNQLGLPTQVTWMSEAGLFGQPTTTTTAPNLGQSTNIVDMLNSRLPERVTPWVDELQNSDTACGNVGSPRQGLVTVIAATQGEEGFIDTNDNGTWDPGETFFDQGEPYVDENDNNQWDPGEPFIDVNGNGVYDGPNGVWDSNTTIWTFSHVAVTGDPTKAVYDPSSLGTLSPGGTEAFLVTFQDENLNETAPTFSTYAMSMLSGAIGSVTMVSPAPPQFIDSYSGMSITAPTTCTTNATSCPGGSACDCTIGSAITFPGPRSTEGIYTAPASCANPGVFNDTIVATDTESVGTETITSPKDDVVSVNCPNPDAGM